MLVGEGNLPRHDTLQMFERVDGGNLLLSVSLTELTGVGNMQWFSSTYTEGSIKFVPEQTSVSSTSSIA